MNRKILKHYLVIMRAPIFLQITMCRSDEWKCDLKLICRIKLENDVSLSMENAWVYLRGTGPNSNVLYWMLT